MTDSTATAKETPQPPTLKAIMLLAPISGESLPLIDHSDPLINRQLLGRGIIIRPLSSRLLAPCPGKIIAISAIGHHITLQTAHGAVIELVVGDNALESHGVGFTKKIKTGQQVQAGDVLLELDLNKLKHCLNSVDVAILVSKGALKITPKLGPKRAGLDHILKLIVKI